MTEFLNRIKEKISKSSGLDEMSFGEIYGYNCIEVLKENLLQAAQLLKSELNFDMLIDIIGVDRFTKNNRFELIYDLWSNERKERLFVRVKLDSKNPEVESLTPIWTTANYEEREAFDMFGIIFLNHPDLRRIYMMDEYEYYPLRKDYPLMGLPGAAELPKK
jgi:NADH-quinone oxidoreductase subunit C